MRLVNVSDCILNVRACFLYVCDAKFCAAFFGCAASLFFSFCLVEMVGSLIFKPTCQREGTGAKETQNRPKQQPQFFASLPKRDLTMFMYKLRRKTFYYYQSARKRGGCYTSNPPDEDTFLTATHDSLAVATEFDSVDARGVRATDSEKRDGFVGLFFFFFFFFFFFSFVSKYFFG